MLLVYHKYIRRADNIEGFISLNVEFALVLSIIKMLCQTGRGETKISEYTSKKEE